jgi:hypothetical protein
MIPPDAVKIVDDKLQIGIVNVISPLTVENIPDGDLSGFVDIKLDGELIEGDEKQAFADQLELTFEGETFRLLDLKQHEGTILPVGGKLTISAPNLRNFTPGEIHTVTVKLNLDNPVEIEVERTIGE